MAYNPFNVFRRNQKGLFAVLTVFVMIMFVLSFGQGDFFQWLPRLIGQERGEVLAKIDGDKVTDVKLGTISTNRGLASDFMTASIDIASSKMDSYIKDSIGQASRDNKQLFIQFYRSHNSQVPYLDLDPQILQFVMSNPQFQQRLPQMRNENISNLRGQLSALVATAGTSKEDLDLAKTALNLLELDLRKMFDTRAGYFGHKSSEDDSARMAFDFNLWLTKADQLGIKFTEEDARKLYLEEFHNQIDTPALVEMEKAVFGTRTNYTREAVFRALADEFRVRIAQNVVLGRGSAPQVFPTSWNAFDFYKKQCDGASYALFSVPAENYMARVPGAPTEGEIRKLYETYRTREAEPAGDNLGLREPRRVKISWIEVQGNEPYYKKAGEESLAIGDVQAKAMFAAMVPMPGMGMGLFAAPAVWNMTDGALTGAYAAYSQRQQQKIDLTWFANLKDPLVANRVELQDVHVAQAENVAALIAAAGGAFATQGGPAFAPLLMIERARIKDREARARTLVAAITAPSAAGSNSIGSALAMFASLPKALPLSTIRTELIEKVKEEATRSAAERDILAFRTEVGKLGEKPDKAEVNAYIAKFVAERGLKFGESKDFRDQYTLGEDPALAPLVAKQTRGHAGMDVPLQFGRGFFMEFEPMTRQEKATTKLFDPKPFPESGPFVLREGEPSFLAWRSGDQASVAPTSLDKAKPKIVELWKRIEARKLAEAAAEELAKKNREMLAARPDAANLTNAPIFGVFSTLHVEYQSQFPNFDEKYRTQFFTLDDVSPIATPLAMIPTAQTPPPRPFQLRPTKQMPYPTPEMQAKLLEKKDDPFGTTLVLHDKSCDRYFVAVLLDRQFRNLVPVEILYSKFVQDAYTGVGELTQVLRSQLQSEETRDAIRNAMMLLRAEFKVTDESDKIKEGAKKK